MPRTLVVALVASVALATYWNALQAPFVWDDDVAITTNRSIHQVDTSLNPPIETPVSGRPAVNLSLALNYAFGGLDPTGYHAVNLAIHVASALLLFGIVRRTLRRYGSHSFALSDDSIALAAALMWVVHPLLSETIDYTTERTESLMGFFFLLTLYAAIRARGSRRPTRASTRSGSPFWTATAVASCAAGMAAKESMVVAPLAVVLYDVIFEFDSFSDALRARGALYAGLAATWAELAVFMWRWPRSTVGGSAVGPVTYALNQAQMIARYLRLAIWPRALVVDYGVPQPLHVADVVPQLLLIVALLAATIVALVRWPGFGFLGAMFFLTLAPTSSVIPISTEVGAERRMYLPLAALTVLVVTLAAHALGRFAEGRYLLARRTAGVLVVFVVAALAARTVLRNRDYDSALTLWQSVVDIRPHGRARFALANELMVAGRHDDATAQLRLAVTDYPDARAGLGTELLLQGKIDEGIAVLQAFVDANPSLPNRAPARMLLAQAHRALAERALSQQNAVLAEEEARKSIAFDGANADAHNMLGAALASQGRIVDAVPEFQAALRLDPKHQSAMNNLARATAMAARTPQTRPGDRRRAP
jgi:tetratricopeptide (TPR) repeat protein